MRSLATSAAANLGRPMPPRLSIDSNRFTLIDSAGNERPHNLLTLDIVIIDLNDHTSKMYFGREYNPSDTEPPLCWSDNGEAPSSQALAPQSPKCMTCPHNAIGSAISKFSGAKIKACVDMKKLAFYIPGEQGIYLMTVKPGSFKNWTAYVNMLAGQKSNNHPGGVELYEVITQLAFESQGVLKFTPVGWSNLQEAEAQYGRGVTPEIVGANDVPYQAQIAAPAAQAALPHPAVQPQAQQVQQPAPFAAQPAAPSTIPSTPGVSTAAPISQGSTAAPEGHKRKRRTKAEIEADAQRASQPQTIIPPSQPAPMFTNPQPAPAPAHVPPAQPSVPANPPQGQAADPLDIPDFLKRTPAPAAAPAAPNGGQFGLAQPAAPSADLQAAIDKAFALPT